MLKLIVLLVAVVALGAVLVRYLYECHALIRRYRVNYDENPSPRMVGMIFLWPVFWLREEMNGWRDSD